ncbi:MAG: class I SAM-dependent methyltransferase [Solirubrobacterales bacterium]|nr:class I SAM-dependent methyltransferase [Solirubrobacterales bacterium]
MDRREMQAMLELDEHHWWYRGRRRVIRAELDRLALPAGARVLDAGCGSGRTLDELADYGEVYGIELDEQAAAAARARGRGEVRIGRLEELPWEADTFELITCLDVIEHTPDDLVTLRELRRVCKPGGWLVVTVPAYEALWSLHDEANHHYRRYSRRTLRAAARGAGWRVARVTSFNSLLLAPAAAVRLAQRRRRPSQDYTPAIRVGPAWLNDALEWPLDVEAAWLGKGRTLPAGLSLLAVLQKAGPG